MTNIIFMCYNASMKNYISKILISLGTLTLFLAVANSASAVTIIRTNYPTYEDCNSSWTTPVGCANRNNYSGGGYNTGYYNNQYAYNQYPTYTTQKQPVVNNYYYPTTTKTVNTSSTSTKSTTAQKTTTAKTTTKAKDNGDNSGEVKGASTGNDLTAMSLRGSGGFLPSSLWQWLIVIFLILIIIILMRLIVRHRNEVDKSEVHAH